MVLTLSRAAYSNQVGTDWFGFALFSLSSDPDISDQGQVLVVVTASVGGFSLLVILTLFLLITGR